MRDALLRTDGVGVLLDDVYLLLLGLALAHLKGGEAFGLLLGKRVGAECVSAKRVGRELGGDGRSLTPWRP